MKQLFLRVNDGSVHRIETPAPNVKAGHVLVETMYSAVSAGTERSLTSFSGKNLLQKAKERPDQVKKVLDKMSTDGVVTTIEAAFNRLGDPMPMGYSAVGRVLAVGRGVTDIEVGELVAMAGQAYHAEINRVNRNLVVPLPKEFPDVRQGAYCALGAIALQGIHQANVMPGETVAIIGLGLIGHICAQILNAYGSDVIGFDVTEEKTLSAPYIRSFINVNEAEPERLVKALTGGIGADKVIIAASTNSNAPMDLAAAVVRDRGTICMIGVTQMNIDRRPYYQKEITFTIARSYGPGRYDPGYEEGGHDYPIGYVRWTEGRNMAEFLRLIAKGRVDLTNLITHEIPFEEAERAYEMITTNASGEYYLGILLKYAQREDKAAAVIRGSVPETNKEKLRVGMIGAGSFARSTLLPGLVKSDRYELYALATTGGISAAQADANYPFAKMTNNYRELLADESIDLIVVCTQHNTHAAIVAEALEAGKHVYVEKPLALTREELDLVESAYRKSGKHLFVGFNRRHSPLIKKIRANLRTDQLPVVYQYTVNAGAIPKEHWSQSEYSGGGRIIGEACHFVDTIQALSQSGIADLQIQFAGDHATMDNAIISMRLENGSVGTIAYTSLGPKRYPKEELRVFAGGACCTLNNYLSVDWYQGGKKTTVRLKQDKGFGAEYQYIHDVIVGKCDTPAMNDVFDNHRFLIRAIDQHKGIEE